MATITNLQGSTQIWNSDEIINQNFQNINNAIVEKTGNQIIAGLKIFTDIDMMHDVTNNTSWDTMRRLSDKRRTKNYDNAWGVEFALYVDSDNAVVWFRKWALRGYLKKWLTWAVANTSELFAIEFDTYDGDATYTSRTSIKTDSLYFNDQNLTGAWTNRTPARDWGITTSVFTVNNATYKQIWKTIFVQAYITMTPSSTGSFISISPPVLGATSKHTSLSTWMWTLVASQAYIDQTSIKFEATFTSWTPVSIMFSWSYPVN